VTVPHSALLIDTRDAGDLAELVSGLDAALRRLLLRVSGDGPCATRRVRELPDAAKMPFAAVGSAAAPAGQQLLAGPGQKCHDQREECRGCG
jgi:hypothetical protein